MTQTNFTPPQQAYYPTPPNVNGSFNVPLPQSPYARPHYPTIVPAPQQKQHKISTDALYIILAVLCVMCLGLSLWLFIQADKKSEMPEPEFAPIAEAPKPKTDFFQTDDESEKVQIFRPQPAGITIPGVPSEGLQASITYLHSGAGISVKHGDDVISICTLTVINPNYGITSGHCGEVGDPVRAINREGQSIFIGNITHDLLPEGGGDETIDVAVVAFTRDVVGFADEVRQDLPDVGDTVSIFGQRSKGSQGHVLDIDNAEAIKSPNFLTDALVRSGDSGGPVYDENGRVLGIVQFSFDSGVSGIAPMKSICGSGMSGVRCGPAAPALPGGESPVAPEHGSPYVSR